MKSRQRGKKKGGSKERVFGCDLLEHLQHSGQEVPQVLRSCAEFVEEHGVVDGIYRLSGVSSNIQKLRQEFEAERRPDLRKDIYLQDIHCVSSLCKAYFRELPDPLLTYRLYDKFAEAVAVQLEPQRLVKIRDVLGELPGPHYRTLEYLMRHLVHMASFSAQTNMHARNLAIVWAPNLLRSKDIEASGFNGTAAFMEVRVQSIVVEFILTHVDQLFGGATLTGAEAETRWCTLPTSRGMASPEDSFPRTLNYHLPSVLQAGDGPPQMRPYHTIIEIGDHKRKGSLKVRKWRSIFNLGRSGHDTKRKPSRMGEDREEKSDKVSLRSAKSMDSLSAAAGASDEPEGLGKPSNSRPSPLQLESMEDVSMAADGEREAEVEPQSGTSSEPGTPRTGRAGARAAGCNRAERCAGVHISDPYNVNLPLHITSILNVPPNIISNMTVARLTRGLECPALQARPISGPSLASGPLDEKMEITSVPTPLVPNLESPKPGPSLPPAQEDSLSQEVQDSFSFLEDSGSSSEPECASGETREAVLAEGTCSPGEDDPNICYLEELLGAGPQVEEFSVEPPLDDLSLDDALFVLAPSCCSPDPGTSELEEDLGEDVFLSAYDDLSPLLVPGPQGEEALEIRENEVDGSQLQFSEDRGERVCEEVGENKEAESGEEVEVEEEQDGIPQSSRPEDREPEEQTTLENWVLYPCTPSAPVLQPGPASGVGMRLASTLVQVQQVKSVPVVPPKPQFAKMPSTMSSKIHVAPATPCPRPGRLDGTPGEGTQGTRASRSSWRNGGSLSFDAAVALARERQRTEAQVVRRTQTCIGGGDGSFLPRTSSSILPPACSARPLSCLESPLPGQEGAGPRSRHSLPPGQSQAPDPVISPQRRTYAFEAHAGLGEGEGL
ncbi:rho GTPase-activating protein 30 [Gracilinanus agilis]|uniref:rho GTPase-activating protein 30 n=1 Tax=Gracilinanus agilis TaxID=191870 RepID=UPI001CFF1DD9|nr:rho GTPase-activating protein 30 [Gracilinanus agilis]